MTTQIKYVFNALVKDTNQPLELMAYSIYKSDKNEIAVHLGQQGTSKDNIDIALQQFHDSVLISPGLLQSYHARARALGEGLVVEIKEGIKAEAKADFIERVEQLVKTEKSWYNHVGMWLMDAIKGVSSTLIVIILFGGVYSIFLTKEERSNLYSAATQSVVDAASGEIPVVDKYREIKAQKEREAKERAAKEQTAKP